MKIVARTAFRISSEFSPRRGAVLAAALVAFLAASAILLTILQVAVQHHRQLRGQRRSLQAESLAQAGLQRAVAQLRQSETYRGETWRVPANELDGGSPAEVEIRVEMDSERPDQRQLIVQADFPSDTIQRSRQTRTATVHFK